MRITMLVIACAALLATSAMVCAGPFSAVPTIKVTGDEFGSDTLIQQNTGFHVTAGYARFQFKAFRPEITALGATLVPGGTFSDDAAGFIVSAEASKMLDPRSGGMIRVGGWYSAPNASGDTDAKLGEIHLGYRFNNFVGVEVGQFFSDAEDVFGKNSVYLTYELPPSPDSDVAFQFGAGTITKSDQFVAPGIPAMERKTDISLFVNGMYGMQNDVTLNVGVWYLRQQFSIPGFTYTAPSGPIAVGASEGNENILNWTLSIGKKF